MGADVLTALRGGLGNQLFEYAATLRVLRETGGSTFDLLSVELPPGWPTIADFVDVEVRLPSRNDRARWTELSTAPGALRPMLERTAKAYEARSGRLVLRTWEPFSEAISIPRGRRVVLDGYFQHPSWWSDDWPNVVRQLLHRAPDGLDDLVAERRAVISLRQRGDYMEEQWSMGPDYYDAVFSEFGRQGVRDVAVVCDEPRFTPWFLRLVESAGFRYVEPTRLSSNRAVNDFWNLAAGATLAIANSTFSWWAAAVATAREPSGFVMFPEPWIPNRWKAVPPPRMGLPGWMSAPSGLADIDQRFEQALVDRSARPHVD